MESCLPNRKGKGGPLDSGVQTLQGRIPSSSGAHAPGATIGHSRVFPGGAIIGAICRLLQFTGGGWWVVPVLIDGKNISSSSMVKIVRIFLPSMRKGLISPKVFIMSFCKSQFPHKSVNIFFVTTKHKLTDLC